MLPGPNGYVLADEVNRRIAEFHAPATTLACNPIKDESTHAVGVTAVVAAGHDVFGAVTH